VGKTVITHTDPVSVPGWSGAEYIILDPDTGEGAYRIGGGLDGSELALETVDLLFQLKTLLAAIAESLMGGQDQHPTENS